MSRTLILHAGTYKTGTTALQQFLFRNRDVLQSLNLWRPDTGAVDQPANWGHHDLARRPNRPEIRDLWRQLRAECEARFPEDARVVVSSEAFSNIRRPQGFVGIARTLQGWAVKPVIYLRRQDRYLESLYGHHVKAVGEYRDIAEFAAMVEHRLDYLGLLTALGRAFGDENIILRVYGANMVDGDICADFLDALGLGMPAEAIPNSPSVNPGLTARGIALMLAANRTHAADPAALARKRRAIVKAHKAPKHYRHSFLTSDARAALIAKYEEDNAAIANRFLPARGKLFPET